ncbi:MAG: hypothetical protein EOP82_24235 [Variovorax sp.]|nr:MAG: hypothetical protein EOP82_24235 [Variovorax sp.]
MATDGSGNPIPDAVREGTLWWNWPLQQWTWPTVAPQQLNQPINPGWSFGNLVSVTNLNSSAPDIERDVLQQHSYGRQIGRLMDAVSLLAERLPAAAKDDPRIAAFELLVRDVERIKRRAKLSRLERLGEELDDLKREDPRAYQKLQARFAR